MLGGKLFDGIKLTPDLIDDPLKSFVYIFGDEDSGTTTLAMSIVGVLPKPEEDRDKTKKVYVLVTEPPHNETGPILKHYKLEVGKGRFVLPTDMKGNIVPITSREQFILFCDALMNQSDVGAVVIDALDSLVLMLFGHHSKKTKFKMDAWGSAADDIIQKLFMPLLKLHVPVVLVTKEKDHKDVKKNLATGKVEVIDHEEVISTVSNKRILRWGSIRIRTLGIGNYTITKTKGKIAVGAKFKCHFEGLVRKGTWLPELLNQMKV
jgi:hypothetical protein